MEVKPLKLRVAVNDIYCRDTACKCVHHVAVRTYSDFVQRLKARHQVELELAYYAEPYLLVRDFLAGQFDGFLCKPWLLLRFVDGRGKTLVRVVDLQDPERNTRLWGVLLVPKDSPIHALRDVAGRRLVLGQEDSYEKHQAVLRLLVGGGVTVPPDRRIEKASCLECLDLLMKAEVDVAAVSHYSLTADCAVDVAKPEDFRVIAETEKIPLTSLMVDMTRVSRPNAWRLQKALVDTSQTGLPESMHGGGFVMPASWAPAELDKR